MQRASPSKQSSVKISVAYVTFKVVSGHHYYGVRHRQSSLWSRLSQHKASGKTQGHDRHPEGLSVCRRLRPQRSVDKFSNVCTTFGLAISSRKTEVLHQPAPRETVRWACHHSQKTRDWMLWTSWPNSAALHHHHHHHNGWLLYGENLPVKKGQCASTHI